MTTRNAPSYARPGRTEAPAWAVLLYIAGLFGAGALGWALIAGVVWAVWLVRLYFVTALAVLVATAVVALCAYLAVKGNWRARTVAAGVFAGLVVFVAWALSR